MWIAVVATLGGTVLAPSAQAQTLTTRPAARSAPDAVRKAPIATPPATRPAGSISESPNAQRMNEWTVGFAGGLLEGSFIRFAAEVAKVLDDGPNLRVLPIVTYGAVGNVEDLLYLKGVDVAITQADVLEHFKKEGKSHNIGDRINYVIRFFLTEVHIYARPEIKRIEDLAGKKVSFNTVGSAANLTGGIVFDRLGVNCERVFINNATALEKMRTGEIAAVVHVVGKPNDLFAKFKPEPGFHFIPVEYSDVFKDFYVPIELNHEDYPNLIKAGESVPSIGVSTVLAVYNWPKESDRYRRVTRFIEYLFARFDQFQKPPYNPKWKEINLAATVPGWKRYPPVEDMIARLKAPEAAAPQATGSPSGAAPPEGPLREKFNAFLEQQAKERVAAGGQAQLSEKEREMLFLAFKSWSEKQASEQRR